MPGALRSWYDGSKMSRKAENPSAQMAADKLEHVAKSNVESIKNEQEIDWL